MEPIETKEERYFKKCLAESHYQEDGKTYVRLGDAVKQLERMYPKTRFALLRRKSRTLNKWAHMILPAFHVEDYVENHNYEDEDNWFALEGSYYDMRKEQQHLIKVNMSA